MRVTNDIHPIPDRMKHILLATKIGLVEGETRMHVRKRLSSLNTGNPFDLVLRGWFRCEDPRVYEKYWHEKFAPFRVRGEWFSLSPDQRLEIKNVMEEYHRTGEFRGNQELSDRVKNKSRQQCRVDAETIRTKAPRSNESFRIEVQAILNKHRRIARHGNGRSYLNETEQVMVEDALAMHPEAEEKIGCGVQKLFVQQSPEFRSFCFYVERVDELNIYEVDTNASTND
eukprot:jgi/Psemu1/40139/gm1.40139_g